MILLELQPEIEAQLSAEAQAYGLPVERYVERIVLKRPAAPALDVKPHSISDAIQRILKLREETDGTGLRMKDLINEGRKY